MKKTPLLFIFYLSMLTVPHLLHAQFTLSGEFRPRTEFRNGFGSIIPESSDPGFGIATRSRLKFGYKAKWYDIYISVQDVMVWGENRQILPFDQNNSFSVFQAWANIKLDSNKTSLKLGRQVLSYDDQRILGGLDWAQQGRNHDAALLKYKKGKFLMDVGFAYNQDYSHPTGFVSEGNAYSTTGFFSYKTMQYLYLKNSWDALSGSILLMNNGFQEFEDDGTTADGISYLYTYGTHIDYKKESFDIAVNAYGQSGSRQGELDVSSAYLASLDLGYKASSRVKLVVGAEIISGEDDNPESTGAFFPLYGTNHKFNGLMDYFYVGNHANSVGLIDLHASANLKLSDKSSLMVKALNFSGQQELPSGETALGTEVDLVYSAKLKGYGLKVGYSQMFASDGMYELKGVAEDAASSYQGWAWAMLIIKPTFFTTKKDQ